ncbi:Transposon Ty2-OR2 Gag-Pol polyprotein [Symbiodinium microadriaticum]|uniref:Transposon Ty2-OR2 Gag-Pol polyprotein n=1 Tax=Symbiodinium microadriaticum TaxID=2951 RepID=A0A1Q9E556_SYMMI|nr:Transposon Ty2-OR2 Gag-Pol polyprotein [Symbiodinium microadriaticum]
MEVEAAPSGSGHKPDLVQGQGPMTQTGGGGERSAEDVVMETDTAAPAESTAGAISDMASKSITFTAYVDEVESMQDVKRYHQHLQAELEAVAVSKTQRDCPTKGGKAAGRGAPTTAEAPTSAGNSAATPKIHRAEPEGEASPSASASATVVTGEPVWTLETLLQAAAKVSGAKAAPATPNINVIAVRAHRPLVGMMQTYALVDSGATHALRRARSQEEWESARPVVVNLAGGESVSLKMNAAGTILIPMTAGSDDTQAAPIVPLGALVGQLGYTMIWGANRCRLEGRNGEVINLRVRDGCPEIAERDALSLISRLEDNNLEELRGNIRDTKKRIKAAAMMMERTWFDHLQSYAQGGISSEAMKAIDQAPFFSGVPRPCLAGLVEAFPESNGWEALKGLEHLNRRTRKKLWSSNKWIVHMFAGDREKRDLLYLEGHGYVILELDIARGRTQDVLRTATWRVLEYAARKGKIAAVIGGPPQGSFMISRYNIEGPRPLRTNDYPYGNWEGQSDVDVFNVNRQTQLVARMIYLHALATAGRITANPDPTCLREEFMEHVIIALRNWGTVPRMVKMSVEQWKDHVRRGPVKVGGSDPDARGAFPKAFKYIFVAKLRVPQSFVEDGRGTWIDYDGGELAEPDYEEKDDGLEQEEESKRESIRVGGDMVEDDQEEAKKLDPEEDIDLAPPPLVNLIFATGIRDDKAATVLEAIQDVVLYCQALNIPILRFHSDRGMEFQARASKQWLKGQGIRVTTSEAGVHQTNGAAEATVRWIKQRARTLMLAAGVPQHLWPTAVSAAATMQRSDVLGFEPLLAAPYGAKVMVRKRQLEGPKPDDLAPKWIQGTYVGRSESLSKGHLVFVKDDDGERFIHTLHVRAGLREPEQLADELEVDEPSAPSRRVRGKSGGSGDIVAISKAIIFDEEQYKARAESLLTIWSQEEAEALIKEVCRQLPPSDNVLVLEDGKSDTVLLDTERGDGISLQKAEVGYTENIEDVLESLEGPLSIVHTVSPVEATRCFEKWVPSLEKEIKSLEHAVERVVSDDPGVQQDLGSKRGQLIPMKVVFAVKPPDPPADSAIPAAKYKRKSRIVICGNMASHQPGEVYTNTAPAEVVRAAIALARRDLIPVSKDYANFTVDEQDGLFSYMVVRFRGVLGDKAQ